MKNTRERLLEAVRIGWVVLPHCRVMSGKVSAEFHEKDHDSHNNFKSIIMWSSISFTPNTLRK